MPQAMKEKFYFYISHLANQVRRISHGPVQDNLVEDHRINRDVARKLIGDWPKGQDFLTLLDRISDEEMSRRTQNFRNGFSHQITPGIHVGMTRFVTRSIFKNQEDLDVIFGDQSRMPQELRRPPMNPGEKRIIYVFGGQEALKLDDVVAVLVEQIQRIHECYDMFKEYVWFYEDQFYGDERKTI
ncbi:hypothetical protein GQF56_16610 [Rhodobacter sphaeroides]|uniref:Uncharacterized protein n=2 Tax=Cereibacter sphaeroides TaxID=1063 RepID=Q3IWD8_CERS4|nr:hypothetical protein RSP_3545 [Cereibacter sphaeroides 2.4.1]AXC63437.1 hypothetical protein DQL45_18800 [Cereibacter sphaeroides 2.4.1]MVX49474.1 hypothetical protein [Cereibacter sphaeroides]QHA11921.1 hypothetical protein GQR99_18775 [Cereibacter sphaeroides]QHA15036.1 hypothetical protein GQY06_18745 [Cereibacter sphaeroides]